MDEHQQLAAGVREGDVLAGKYRIDKVLGIGGMGVVVAAHHIQLDDRVAIKFLLPEALANRETVARFAREAQAAVKIKSEHVARVSDVGTLENGAPFMVMEYLDGGDLAAWIAKRGALPAEQAVEFVLQACEAIAEAHSLGIVHRDLKPANLFVIRRPDGGLSVKVLDFGISKRTGFGTGGSSMTRTSAVMGSPLYMSPEQMQSSKDTDPRSDIWALGIILYELLTGDAPFVADTMPELVLKIISSPAPLLRSMKPEAPIGLERVILRCLERDRAKRYQSIGELATALVEHGPKRARASLDRITGILRGAGMAPAGLSSPPPSEPVSVAAPPPGTAASWGQTAAGTARSKGPMVAIAAALVLVGVGIGGYVLRAGGASKPEPSAEVSGAQPETSPQPVATVTAKAPPPEPVAPAASASDAPHAPAAPDVAPATATPQAAAPQAGVPLATHAAHTGKAAAKPAAHVSPTPVVAAPAAQPASHAPPAAPAAAPPPAAPKPNVYDDRK